VRRTLKGRRIAVLATDGVEKVELSVPVKALMAAGADVDLISIRRGRIRSVNLHEPASRFRVDKTLQQVSADDYDALLMPGGLINPDMLRQSADARDFVRDFDKDEKPIASICHGPWVLASAGLLDDRILTSWPGIRDDMVNAGATWLDDELVYDRNLITSRGPQDLVPFTKAMLKHFEEGASLSRRTRASKSSPQRDEPPKAMIGAMKWLPKPSTRTALILGAAAAGIYAYAAKNPKAVKKLQKELARRVA
jgi:protease I